MQLILGDCLERLREMNECSVDSIVTDPPYGISFMGKKWDYDVPSVEVWAECLRVLKPGGHLLAFAGTRTQHRMAVRIEDAGFEIRDMIAWVYGSGFPKSLDVSKAIDKAAGYKRTTEYEPNHKNSTFGKGMGGGKHGAHSEPPATEAARQWQGWGTALKPALEPITVARKPLGSTVAECVLAHGTGAMNVDGCRIRGNNSWSKNTSRSAPIGKPVETCADHEWGLKEIEKHGSDKGRWPTNLIHDGSDKPCALLGDAARFFYCAKASKKDRETDNIHPTVKPTDLMRYLCRLVTPPNGVVLDPFMGSGSTGKAAMLEGFQFIGIERDEKYMKIAEARTQSVKNNVQLDNDL